MFFKFQKSTFVIFIYGILSGLPLSLTLSVLSVWLHDSGVDYVKIGVASIVGLPYIIKFLWAPLFDHLKIPILYNLFGIRRSMIIILQILLSITMMLFSIVEIGDYNFAVFVAFFIALFSASQDIVIDAYRIEISDQDKMTEGVSANIIGYRVGILLSSYGCLQLADLYSWFVAFSSCAIIMMCGVIFTIFVAANKETTGCNGKITAKKVTMLSHFKDVVISPFNDFIKSNYHWATILLFILFYKLGDAFLAVMHNAFLLDMGFSKSEIATYVKSYGLIAMLAGVYCSQFLSNNLKIIKSLWLCGILQCLSNFVYIGLFNAGYNINWLMFVVYTENFTGGLGTAIFTTYISNLCNKKFTATQFALLTSLASIGRVIIASSAGVVVASIGWMNFFIISAILAIPGMYFLSKIQSKSAISYSRL